MELPHIGEHCSEVSCRQLDFLPFTCPLCKNVYCLQHQKLDAHNCPHANSLDVRVPVCPLCNKAVPAPRGQSPDIAISEHLDNNCAVKKEKIFTNKCSYKHCKKKELMPIQCPQCRLNFCIPHRHPNDHNCSKITANGHASRAAAENGSTSGSFLNSLRTQAASRFGSPSNAGQPNSSSTSNTWQRPSEGSAVRGSRQALSQLQGGMSEDEALALALQQSQALPSSAANASRTSPAPPSNNTSSPSTINPTDEEAMLQRAIAESLRDSNQRSGRSANRNSSQDCNLL